MKKSKIEEKAKAKSQAKNKEEDSISLSLSSEEEASIVEKPLPKNKRKAPEPEVAENAEIIADEKNLEDNPIKEIAEENKDVDEEAEVLENEEEKEEFPNESTEVELFICNLPFTANEEDVRAFFKPCGKIKFIKLLRRNGISTGRGFITFVDPEGAAKGKELNSKDFKGRPITSRYSSEPIPEHGAKQRTKAKSVNRSDLSETKSIFVGGLSYDSTSKSVGEFFMQCGNVTAVRIATSLEGESRGFAHVDFDDSQAIQHALKLSGEMLDGRTIRVDIASNKVKANQEDFQNTESLSKNKGAIQEVIEFKGKKKCL